MTDNILLVHLLSVDSISGFGKQFAGTSRSLEI